MAAKNSGEKAKIPSKISKTVVPVQSTSNKETVAKVKTEDDNNTLGGPLTSNTNIEDGKNSVELPSGSVKLPNQPLTPITRHTSVIATEVPKKPEVCTAAVKWKSKLSVLDGIRPSGEEPNASFGYEKLPSPRDPDDGKPKLSANGKSVSLDIPEDGTGADDDAESRRGSAGEGNGTVAFLDQTQRSDRLPTDVSRSEQLEARTLDNSLLAAVPYMPRFLAYTCLVLNILIPGTGTIIAGLSMICCAKPRGHVKPDKIFSIFSTNLFVGVAQLFTVSFLLVGWIWSITWGVYMVLFAEAYLLKQEEEKRYRQTVAVANALWRK